MQDRRNETASPADQPVSLDSVSVRVDDIETASAFLTDIMGWRRHPLRLSAGSNDATGNTADSVFIDGNGAWLQLVEASTSESGPGALKSAADGGFFKLNFATDAYDAVLARLRSNGAHVENLGNAPMVSDGGHTQRVSSCARDASQNATTDIYEIAHGGENNVLSHRDQTWERKQTNPDAPRIDRIAVIVEDIEASSDFYTEILGLQRHPMRLGVPPDANEEIGGFIPAFIFAGSAWLVLVQPVGKGPLMNILEEKGDGSILEIITEVDDVESFFDRMKSRDITLLRVDGTPLDEQTKCQVLEPHGDKLAYLPPDVSQGMAIEVFERGPRESSLIHQRDDTFTA